MLEFVIWGSGTPRREFLHVDDAADALVHLMTHYSGESHVNVGCGSDLTILELASMIADVVGFTGEIVTDPSKPDGTPRKLLDMSKLERPWLAAENCVRRGLASTYSWFVRSFRAAGESSMRSEPKSRTAACSGASLSSGRPGGEKSR